MKKLILLAIALSPLVASADTAAEKESLTLLLREMETVNELLDHAERQAEDNVIGTSFNYRAIRNDLVLMKRGIEDYINDRYHTPRRFEPLQGDYRR